MKCNTSDFLIFEPNRHIKFDLDALETYGFARRETSVVDALTVMAAVDYADRVVRRPAYIWRRDLHIQVPLYEPDRWTDVTVSSAVDDVLRLLTGDNWTFDFIARPGTPPPKPQEPLDLGSTQTRKVMAYSDGLDSRTVVALEDFSSPGAILRVRVGSSAAHGERRHGRPIPFTGIPYSLKLGRRPVESSARSRGFRFAMFAGIAAYLVDAGQAVVPESGQGIFGPVLTATLQGYPDYRNHPMFTVKVAKLIESVFGHKVEYAFPRMWSTKGETLSALRALNPGSTWEGTRSCWQDARWCSIQGKRLQCGVCAACLLRRQSFHSAGIAEPPRTYAFENLRATSFEGAAPTGFRVTKALNHYAIGAVQQLDHFNIDWLGEELISRHAASVALVTSIPFEEVQARLGDLIDRHAKEWTKFVEAQGETSFIRQWVGGKS